jgi:hypothetical protein
VRGNLKVRLGLVAIAASVLGLPTDSQSVASPASDSATSGSVVSGNGLLAAPGNGGSAAIPIFHRALSVQRWSDRIRATVRAVCNTPRQMMLHLVVGGHALT